VINNLAQRKKIKARSTINKLGDKRSKWHAVPLKGSFMLTSMLGFLISAYWVYPQSSNYGISFMLVFAAMFISSLLSLAKAPMVQ
jgi:hypothetical protein